MSRSVARRLSVLVALFAGLGASPPTAPLPRTAPPERGVERGRAFATDGRIDLFVAATAAWGLKPDDDRLWKPAFELTDRLVRKAEFRWWPPEGHRKGFRSLDGFRNSFNPQFIRTDELHQLKKAGVPGDIQQYHPGGIMSSGVTTANSLIHNILVSRGDIRAKLGCSTCLIYGNGDLVVGSVLSATIVVCDGNVTVGDNALNSLVVARGDIVVKGLTAGCTFVAGGRAQLGHRTIRPKELLPSVTENEANAFNFVTFFELSRVGLQVKVADGTTQVATVAAKSAGEKAGVRAGDVVLDVGGKKPTDAESLRRLLRDALAIGDATLKLKRGDRTETVKLSLDD